MFWTHQDFQRGGCITRLRPFRDGGPVRCSAGPERWRQVHSTPLIGSSHCARLGRCPSREQRVSLSHGSPRLAPLALALPVSYARFPTAVSLAAPAHPRELVVLFDTGFPQAAVD